MEGESGEVILKKMMERFFIINMDALFQRLTISFRKIFGPVGEYFHRFGIVGIPQSDFSVTNSQKKPQTQRCGIVLFLFHFHRLLRK